MHYLGHFLIGIAFYAFALVVCSNADEAKKLPVVRFTGLPVIETAALIDLLETRAFSQIADEAEFIPWNNPDQLRALLVSGQVDVAVIPSNVAVTLFNKDIPIRLLMVSEAKNLMSIVSAEGKVKALSELKGKQVAIPFRNDMPDFILTRLLSDAGLSPETDVERVFTADPIQAVQLLLTGRVNHAFLAEPMITLAQLRAHSLKKDDLKKVLHRSASIANFWADGPGAGRGPFVGAIAIRAGLADEKKFTNALARLYRKSFDRMIANPSLAAKSLTKYFPQLKSGIIASAFGNVSSEVHVAHDVQAAINNFFLQILMQYPDALGGALPDKQIFVDVQP